MPSNHPGIKNFRVVALFALELSVVAGSARAQQPSVPPVRYNITDLGTLGGPFSEAVSVNNRSLVSGASSLPDGTTHAVLWQQGRITDIAATGLGDRPVTAERLMSTNGARPPAQRNLPLRIQTVRTFAVSVPT